MSILSIIFWLLIAIATGIVISLIGFIIKERTKSALGALLAILGIIITHVAGWTFGIVVTVSLIVTVIGFFI